MDIKALRKIKKLSQAALAARVGVSMMTVQLWERGAMNPTPDNLEKLVAALESDSADPLPFAQ